MHTAIGQGDMDYEAIFAQVRAMETQPAITIELPTRLIREPDGTAYPPLSPMPLGEIEELLSQSLMFILQQR